MTDNVTSPAVTPEQKPTHPTPKPGGCGWIILVGVAIAVVLIYLSGAFRGCGRKADQNDREFCKLAEVAFTSLGEPLPRKLQWACDEINRGTVTTTFQIGIATCKRYQDAALLGCLRREFE